MKTQQEVSRLTRQDVVEVIDTKTKQLVGYATISVTETGAAVSGYGIEFEEEQTFSNEDRLFARRHIFTNLNDGLPYTTSERWELLRERIEVHESKGAISFVMMHGRPSTQPDTDFEVLHFEIPANWGVALLQNKPVIVIN